MVQPVALYASHNATPGDIVSCILNQVTLHLERLVPELLVSLQMVINQIKSVELLWDTWEERKITCSIPNSYYNRRLGAFSDAVHIIKCITNHFHDQKQVHYNNIIVDYKFYQQLYELDRCPKFSELRVCHKLTSAHLDPSSFQSMNVRLIFQLFSNSEASGLNFLSEIESEGFADSLATERFTKDVNCLVDILNSSTPAIALYKISIGYQTLIKWRKTLS